MSTIATTSAPSAAAPPSGGVVRGGGNAPGQNPGEAMPDIPQGVERARLSDFKKVVAARSAAKQPAAAKPATTAGGRVGEFSRALEAKQDAARGQVGQPPKSEPQGDPDQIKDPASPAEGEPDHTAPEEGAEPEPQETAPDAATDLDALSKYREWEQSDMFPDEMLGKLHELKANGITRYVDTNELKQGYIRGVDYRRFHAEAQQVQGRAQQYETSMRQHFEQIRDPAQMLEIYERNGYGDTLYGMAQLIAERDREDRGMIRAAGIDVMQRRGINDPNHREVVDAMKRAEERVKAMRKSDIDGRRNTFDRQQLDARAQQERSQTQTQQHYANYEKQLNQLRPLAFKAFGLEDSAAHRSRLLVHLKGVIDSNGGITNEGLTRDLIMTAARDLAEERETDRNAGRAPVGLSPEQWQRVQAAKQSKALPAQRMGTGGGGKPLANGANQPRGRLSDMVKAHKAGTLGR
jgi:hypothetical protein